MPVVYTQPGLGGFELIDDWLAGFEALVELECYAAMFNSLNDVQDSGRQTDSYNDDTGATRNSTVAYVYSRGDGLEAQTGSIEVANSYRPFSASDDSRPPVEDVLDNQIILDVMSATDYSYHLNTRKASEGAYLELAIVENYSHIMTRIADAVGDALL